MYVCSKNIVKHLSIVVLFIIICYYWLHEFLPQFNFHVFQKLDGKFFFFIKEGIHRSPESINRNILKGGLYSTLPFWSLTTSHFCRCALSYSVSFVFSFFFTAVYGSSLQTLTYLSKLASGKIQNL